ncbi:M48 family metalloprotease [Nocardia asteroides]|uniref:M48 family metalloprotease n=1 Tax=Nocardia asteroides TaxID=1824 RepID=UPI0034001051
MTNSEPNRLAVTYRRGARWALAELVASLPSIVLSAVLLAEVAALLANWFAVVVLVLWAGSGPALLAWRRIALGAMAQWSAGHLPDENKRVTAAWASVLASAGLPADGVSVWVIESATVNGAVHTGGHVTVTRHAVEVFTRRQLEALLAHELGHRLQGTATWRSLVRWYARPFECLVRLVFAPADLLMGWAVPRLSAFADRVLAALRYSYLGLVVATALLAGPAVLAYGTAACLGFAALALLLGPWPAALASTLAAAQLLLRPQLWQHGEYLADRVVVDLGYLDDFRVVLRVLHHRAEAPGQTEPPTLLATHPAPHSRLSAAEQYARTR